MTTPNDSRIALVRGVDVLPNRLTLKWGSVKGWELHTDEAVAALQKWAAFGVFMSAAMQRDTPEQQEALLAAIDHMDEIYLDWEGITVSRDEAKEYVRTYDAKRRASATDPQP